MLHTQAGPAAAATAERASVVGNLMARGMRRLSLLLDHLRPLASSGAPAAVETRREMASQAVTTAAMHAQTPQELDANLAPLRQVGVEIETEKLLRTLAGSLAGWALPAVEGHAAPAVSKDQLEAVRRIVSLPEDPAEVARRFREMVHAAIEQFNAGEIGRAVALFDLAEQLAAEKKVQPKFVEALRASGHEYLDMARLHSAAARNDYRAQLKRILGFFTPTQPAALLLQLDGEPRRDRRHQILALLEVHGEPARAAAWELLKASVQEGAQTDPFFQMNLVYLLRVIRRPDDVPVEEEVDVVMRTSARDNPPPLVKQVIALLGGTRHDKAERALITYLKVFESMMLEPETAAYPPADVEMLLDRTCAALARYGTPRAWRVLVDHGLKAEARLGSPAMRLAEAGRVNLSADRELVARLIATIRAELPKGGVAGLMSRGKSDDKAIALIQALAGTPLPGVYELLQEVGAQARRPRAGQGRGEHAGGAGHRGPAAGAALDAVRRPRDVRPAEPDPDPRAVAAHRGALHPRRRGTAAGRGAGRVRPLPRRPLRPGARRGGRLQAARAAVQGHVRVREPRPEGTGGPHRAPGPLRPADGGRAPVRRAAARVRRRARRRLARRDGPGALGGGGRGPGAGRAGVGPAGGREAGRRNARSTWPSTPTACAASPRSGSRTGRWRCGRPSSPG